MVFVLISNFQTFVSFPKMQVFSPEEYQAFKKPFELGWKREVVLRGNQAAYALTPGKKAGDVYYHLPDGRSKLRSYVEMGMYRKFFKFSIFCIFKNFSLFSTQTSAMWFGHSKFHLCQATHLPATRRDHSPGHDARLQLC